MTDPIRPRTFGNFDLIRIVAAASVLFHHSFTLAGDRAPKLHTFGHEAIDFGSIGVGAFFVISGFLITTSWERDPVAWRYAVKRLARIWPAFVVVLAATALVLGPLVTDKPLVTYLRSAGTRAYLTNNVFFYPFNRQALNGVFFDVPYRGITNGSLWTLPYEMLAYLVVLVIGLVAKLRRVLEGLVLVAAAVGVTLIDTGAWKPDLGWGPINIYPLVWLGSCFFVGAVLRHVPVLWTGVAPAVGGAVAIAAGVLVDQPLVYLAGFALVVLTIGTKSSGLAATVSRAGDPSYGLYLYAFPVQQTIMWAGLPHSTWALTAVALPISLGLGYVSWHVVERPAMSFARRRILTPRTAEPVVTAAG